MNPVRPFLVVGAGLAGSTVARALANRGHSVIVVDSARTPAAGTSGNPAGLFMPVLERAPSARERLYLEALASLHDLLEEIGMPRTYQQDGVLHLPRDARQAERFRTILDTRKDLAGIVESGQPRLPPEASGHPHAEDALFYPGGGWLSPAGLCHNLLEHSGIEWAGGCAIRHLSRNGAHWTLTCDDGRRITAEHVILACGSGCLGLDHAAWLPWHLVRGQVTRVRHAGLASLPCPVTGMGYVIPLGTQEALTGATYRRDRLDTTPDPQEDQENLEHVVQLLPGLAARPKPVDSRAGLRTVLPGRLPACGPLLPPQKLRSGRKPVTYANLWITAGHASRGLLTAPLCAQIITAGLLNEVVPDTAGLLDPARFLKRD
ncbi:MAG: FAD-dependent oxidoreductase [Gammaproteobacteria bacterium]|nr:MAG: FAD-dependent oxidoreductase [Gammaproteobacteria bacterium]